jgi:hypothetical protein
MSWKPLLVLYFYHLIDSLSVSVMPRSAAEPKPPTAQINWGVMWADVLGSPALPLLSYWGTIDGEPLFCIYMDNTGTTVDWLPKRGRIRPGMASYNFLT